MSQTLAAVRAEWPLVGRTTELRRVRDVLDRGTGGIAFAGPPGVGKTRLGTEAIALARDAGHETLRIGATQASSGLPFGAFAPLLPELEGGDRTDTLRRVARSIADRGAGKRVAVLVDDAHLLDHGSAALMHQLATTGQAIVLATVRSTEPASDAVVALWKDNLVERIDLDALSAEDVREMLAAALGGVVDDETARPFWERTRGNVLFLRELVLAAVESGTLRAERGEWRLHGRLPVSARLIELIESRLDGLSDDERHLTSLLALGEPLDVDVLERIGHGTGLPALEARGLARIEADGRNLTARLGHPIYGEVLRARQSPLRSRELSRTLADAFAGDAARGRTDILRIATWTLAGGGEFDPALMLDGATQAFQRHDLRLAERLGRASWDAGGGFDAGLFVGTVLGEASRFAEAEAIFAALDEDASTDRQRALLATSRGRNLMLLRGPREAAEFLEEREPAMSEPRDRVEVAAQRAFVLIWNERLSEARDVLESAIADATGRPLGTLCFAGSLLYEMAGRFTDALRLSDLALRPSPKEAVPFAYPPALHRLRRVTALSLAGEFGRAEDAANEWGAEVSARADPTERAYHAYATTRMYIRQGRGATALRWARLTERLAPPFGESEHSVALITLAHALALMGMPDEAADAIARHDALPRGVFEFAHEVGQVRAWVCVAEGDVQGAIDLLTQGAASARAQGSFGDESSLLHDLARLGRASSVADRLAELVEDIEGPFAPARAMHAHAIVAGDAQRLDDTAVAFERIGALLHAAEAAGDAAVAWRREGEPRLAAASERRAAALAVRCEGAHTPALGAVTARAVLTARELEIARLAASGASNKEIAERLVLSVRTVENKLHAVYSKLGVSKRAELPGALEGL